MIRLIFRLSLLLTVPVHALLTASQNDGGQQFELKLEGGQGYDNNVYLVDQGSLAKQASPVTSVTPEIAWTPAGGKWRFFYSGRASLYWNDRSEDNIRHNLGGRGSFSGDIWSGQISSTLTRVQGSREGVIFDAGRNAFSTTIVRERREQWQNRSSGEITLGQQNWFVRGSGRLLYYDLDTVWREGVPGYDNYVNRYDIHGGIDVGRRTGKAGDFHLGWQHGYQHQGRQGGRPSDRSNHYDRFLFGWQFKAHPQLSWSVVAGPEIHRYDSGPGATRITSLYLDASARLEVTPKDRLELIAARRKWVGSTGLLSNNVINYSARWQHTLSEAWQVSARAAAQGLDYDGSPVDDWMYTAALGIEYRLRDNLRTRLTAERNFGRDRSRHLPGREFNRTWVGLQLDWQL